MNENWLKLDVCHRKDDNVSPLTLTWLYVGNVYVQTYKMFIDGSIAPVMVNNSAKLKVCTTLTAETLYCSTRENLPIDVSIVMEGLILTKRDRFQYCNTSQFNQNACCSAELAPPFRMQKLNATNI